MSDTAPPVQPRRSFIFCPGTDPAMYPKALASGADIVCVELEDGVGPAHKATARANMLRIFGAPQADDGPGDGIERIVRVNGLRTPDGLADMAAIVNAEHRPPALMLPKVKGPEEVAMVAETFDELGVAMRLQVIIETNAGLEAAHEIARASDRVDSLLFGGVDLAADLRCAYGWEPLLYARSRVVHAAAAAGIDAIDVPWLDLADMDGMAEEARRAADLGYTGKGAIHPRQIAALNEIYSPSAAQIDHARRIVAAFAATDSGLVVVDGKLIEKPVLRTMHRILAVADRAGN
jgi:citrate lyase beta subunit